MEQTFSHMKRHFLKLHARDKIDAATLRWNFPEYAKNYGWILIILTVTHTHF